jgi:hypothetical protein
VQSDTLKREADIHEKKRGDFMEKKISARDDRGVRQQSYKRFKEGKDYLPIQADETRAIIEVIKKQFQPSTKSTRKKYESLSDFKEVILSYFDYIADSNEAGAKLIPDIEGFCCYAGICRDTLNDWEHTRQGEYSDTIKTLKNAIASFKKQLALKGKIPPIVFATDFNNNHGYTQKQEVTLSPIKSQLEPSLTREQIIEKIKTDVVIDIDDEE